MRASVVVNCQSERVSRARRPARPAVPMVGAWRKLEAPAPRAVQTPADPAAMVRGEIRRQEEIRRQRETRRQGERPAAVTHLPPPEGFGV
jgi:hypothetical protein